MATLKKDISSSWAVSVEKEIKESVSLVNKEVKYVDERRDVKERECNVVMFGSSENA